MLPKHKIVSEQVVQKLEKDNAHLRENISGASSSIVYWQKQNDRMQRKYDWAKTIISIEFLAIFFMGLEIVSLIHAR